jgi:pimeloyl-ACP methyl ester carboxylesterase
MNERRYRAAEERLWASLGPTRTERRLSLERTGGSVRIQELGEGPDVVFVHGANNSGTSWAPLVAGMEGFHCVLLDRPGCGLSDPVDTVFADPDALAAFAEDVMVDVLDALDLRRAHLVGTSYGGYFVLRTAAAHPERVQRLVEFGWTLGAPMATLPPIMRAAGVWGVRQLMAAVPPTKGAVRAMFRQIGLRQALAAGRVSDELIDWYQAQIRDTDTVGNELRTTSRLLSPVRGVDEAILLSADLRASITTPCSFLWGDQDPFGGGAIARDFVAPMPHAELELLPGAGHAVWIDEPDHAATVTRAFLDADGT